MTENNQKPKGIYKIEWGEPVLSKYQYDPWNLSKEPNFYYPNAKLVKITDREAKEQPQSLENAMTEKNLSNTFTLMSIANQMFREPSPVQSQETGEVTVINAITEKIFILEYFTWSAREAKEVATEVYSQFIQPLQQELKRVTSLITFKEAEKRFLADQQQITSLKAEIERLKIKD